MKKMFMFVVALSLTASGAWAGCMGPFCYDDTGAYIAGTLNDGNGAGTPNMTKAQVLLATPRAKGQEIFCTNCTNFNSTLGFLCVSTGTAIASYAAISSATAVTACQ